jgi:uncharacterized Zn finger protein
MSEYKPCPRCGSDNIHEVKKWEPDDGDPRASNVLFIECRTCGYATLPRLWNTAPKHITLERAEKAEAERDEARKLVTDFCIAGNNNTADLIAATFHMTQAQREWK